MNIYIASNGDIFAAYDTPYKAHTPEEVAHIYAQAARLLSEGQTTFCTAKRSGEVIPHLSYYDESGAFIATADIHIAKEFNESYSLFYLRRLSDETPLKAAVDSMAVTVGAAMPLTEWAAQHGIDPATARQRAIRGAFRTARKLGRNWIIDKDEPLVDHRRK